MFEILDFTQKDIIAVRIKGTIGKEDYDKINPLLEKTEKDFDAIKLYVELREIEGVTPKAVIEDVITYFKHRKEISKLAVVGEKQWQKIFANMANPFVKAEIQFFDYAQTQDAREWLK
jgi:hypothetical protein